MPASHGPAVRRPRITLPLPYHVAAPQVQEMEALQYDLDEAVEKEDYRAAAALKAQLDGLEAADCVGAALAELAAAVQEERFAGEGWPPLAGQVPPPLALGVPRAAVGPGSCCG